ncbi:MAG: HD-GYP domain-containing protein [Spirochaetota bacterium]|nr:HD-GYP domain-containing protein [Spirochaetota bacterium]
MEKSKLEKGFLDLGDTIKIEVKYLKAGTRLALTTFDEVGNQITPPNTPFTQEKINELLLSGVEEIFYSKPNIKNKIDKGIEEYLISKTYKGPRSISIETQKNGIDAMKQIVNTIKNNEKLSFNRVKDVIDRILHEISYRDERIINLLAMQIYDENLYIHSLNTGIIAMVFAKDLGMDDKQIKDIGIAGFLHDIGKVKVPNELLYKKDPLLAKEFIEIKKHVTLGYELIKDSNELSESTKEIILSHHEKFNGEGYPANRKGDDISDGAYIVGIAEMYDFIITEHPYRKAMSQADSMKCIREEAGVHFKGSIANEFVKNMYIFLRENLFCPVDSFAVLNTGEIAKVISYNKNSPLKPVVIIHVDEFGKIIPKPFSVDLQSDKSREIIKPIDFQQFANIDVI